MSSAFPPTSLPFRRQSGSRCDPDKPADPPIAFWTTPALSLRLEVHYSHGGKRFTTINCASRRMGFESFLAGSTAGLGPYLTLLVRQASSLWRIPRNILQNA